MGVIREIVSTMRALSAVHLRHASDALTSLRPYALGLEDALAAASLDRPSVSSPRAVLVIVQGTDQGLCGPLTLRVVERAQSHIALLGERYAGCIAVGRRVHDALRGLGLEPRSWQRAPSSVRGVDERVAGLAKIGESLFEAGLSDGADVVYAKSLGAGSYEPAVTRVFPLAPERLRERACAQGLRRPPRLSERPAEVFTKLIDEWLYTELYRASLETLAAEHGARLRTTDAALTVIDKRLEVLRLDRNHARQDAITSELQEIVQAAEAQRAR